MTERVVVLAGGRSAEREVSLRSGWAVALALRERGYEVVEIDAGADLAERLKEAAPDVVFVALHGKFGEDGCVQGFLEVMDIPYTGSGVLASALAMDKIATKRLLQSQGLPTAAFAVVERGEWPGERDRVLETIGKALGDRLVVKVPDEGSSLGTFMAHDRNELAASLDRVLEMSPRALVEEFLPGMEVHAALVGNENPRVLPLIEIVPLAGEFYDYRSKYAPGGSEHIIPPRLPEEVQGKIRDLAARTYRLLGCSGFARVDLRLAGDDRPMVLEVNTIPGLTETSLVPDAARAAGISFGDLVEEIIRLAKAKKFFPG
ncbi:MAG: D-alanine--D-alanine ligase [Clostridia bacterium]|nr:MAG: D-alanine--D-alanine ligase [Clostridia bacterium]